MRSRLPMKIALLLVQLQMLSKVWMDVRNRARSAQCVRASWRFRSCTCVSKLLSWHEDHAAGDLSLRYTAAYTLHEQSTFQAKFAGHPAWGAPVIAGWNGREASWTE